MNTRFTLLLIAGLCALSCHAQVTPDQVTIPELTPPPKKGEIYFTWGYHRDAYTKSTIEFKDRTSDNYDFTFHNAKAKDQPDWDHFFETRLTVPQFVLNIGYFFPNKNGWGVEFSWDHLKYVVIDDQVMHMTGDIRGKTYNQDTLVTPAFVHYEHTNGNNYAMFSGVKKLGIFDSKNGKFTLDGLFKAGAGLLHPKTESDIMGKHNDGPFKTSGFVIGTSANLRFGFFRYLYAEFGIKGAFADYTSAKLVNDGKATQTFFSVQYITALGLRYPLGKAKAPK